jgi:cephalosporin hydroxylase
MSLLRHIFDGLPKSSDKWDPYFEIYERHVGRALQNLMTKKRPLTFIEVGVQKGGSLDMWSQYFRREQDLVPVNVIGIDVDPECAKLTYDDAYINVEIGDQGNPEFWDSFSNRVGFIDIFVDDGGHYMDQQILTFEKVFPLLSVGGVYICEDCHTSYMSGNGGGLGRKGTFIEYAKKYVDVLHYNWKEEMTSDLEARYKIGKDLSGLFFYDSVVVFEKHEKGVMKRVFPKAFPPL